MNITDNLIRIKEGKDNIIKSLKNKGVEISDNTLINEIPTIIDNAEIGGGGGDTPVQPETPELVPKYEGATVFRINVPEDNYEFAINLCNDATKATYDVDWGDGSLESGLTTDEQHHTYTKKGVYDINVYNISKEITLGGSYNSSGNNNNNPIYVYYLFNNIHNDYWNVGYIVKKDYICTDILIGDNVTTIGDYAFQSCSSLQSLTIGNSVTSIGSNAFQSCSSLQSLTIGNSVTSIGSNAFYGCSSLQSLTIGNSVTSIGSSAFYGCSSLQSIVIPDSVTNIYINAFQNCYSLQSLTIGNSVTNIYSSVFQNCSSLQSLIIGNSVTKIDNSAFNNCFNSQSVTCNALTPPTISSSLFPSGSNKYTKKYLYVHKDADIETYTSGNWKTYVIDKGWELRYIEDRVKTPTTLKLKTTNNFFHNLQAIGQANLIDYELIDNEYIYHFDDKITELIQYTFYNKVLEEIELPEGLEIIGSSAFSNYYYLHSITCKAMIAPTIQSNTFSSVGSQVPSGTPKVLRVPEGSDYSTWKSKLSGFTIEYVPLSEL